MKTSSLTRSASVLVAFALVLGACAKDTDAPSDSTSSVVAASPDSAPPTDPNVTVVENPAVTELKLTSGGGFTTWQYNVSTLPIAWITGDVLYRGIPNESMNPTVTKAKEQSFNRVAREKLTELLSGAGFVGDPLDFGQPGISDMPTTTLEFVLNGTTYRHDAYALGVSAEMAGPLTDEQQKNRTSLSSLIELISDPTVSYGAENVGAPTDFVPTSYALWGQGYPRDAGEGVPVPGDRAEIPWTHDSISLSMFLDGIKCRPVSVAEAPELAATFAALASGDVFFAQESVRADLALVPTLPGLDPCPAVA
jgi:hypothetical protein